MKKFVKASTTNGDINKYAAEVVENELLEIPRGYTANVVLDGEDITITISKHKDPYMPDIQIESMRRDNYLYLNPILSFPVLTWNEGDNADDIAYYLDEWSRLGNFITTVNNFVFDYSKWTYDPEYDEWYY